MTQATASTSAGAARLFSDDRLAQRATKGDRRAFAAIYKRYHQDLYRYCAAILGNPEDAHDALQNTMVKVLSALPGEKRQIQLKPWLYRIAHNESIELLRRRRPTEQIDPDLEIAGTGAAETVEVRERLRRLIADLEDLPDRQRGALVMRELAGLSFEQIGATFDTSPAVARQTVYEARIGLQQMNEGREMPCEEVCRALSGGDGRTSRRRDIRAHLSACPNCRAFQNGVVERRHDFAALAPLPTVASAGLLHAILAGGQGSSGAAAAGAVGVGAGKAVATSAIVKSAATVAVVAAVGVSAADRSNLIHVGLPGDATHHNSQAGGGAPSAAGAGAGPAAQALKTSTKAGGKKSTAKTQGKTHNGDNAVGAGASHGHGGNTTTTPASQQSPGTQHGKGQTGRGHRGGSPASHGKGHQGAAAHGGHSHSSSHGHSHKAVKSHPNPSSASHPSPSIPPPKPHVNNPPPSPPPPTSPDTSSSNSPDNPSSAAFQPTQ